MKLHFLTRRVQVRNGLDYKDTGTKHREHHIPCRALHDVLFCGLRWASDTQLDSEVHLVGDVRGPWVRFGMYKYGVHVSKCG
jgi:hypothetical protein